VDYDLKDADFYLDEEGKPMRGKAILFFHREWVGVKVTDKDLVPDTYTTVSKLYTVAACGRTCRSPP
jgi:hypothetical protein